MPLRSAHNIMVAYGKKFALLLVLLTSVVNYVNCQSTTGCDVNSYSNCIHPVALGSSEFKFEPLFPSDATFVYAFDIQTEDELAEEAISPGATQVPDAKVAFWLDYPESDLTPSDRQETYMAVLLNQNITGEPGNGHNGCDGVWGSECSTNLVRFLKTQIASASFRTSADLFVLFYSIGNPTDELQETIDGLGCPSGLFEERYFVTGPAGSLGGQGVLAYENGEDTSIMASGNVTHPFVSEQIRDTTYDDLISRVAVALIARVPLEGDLYQEEDNIQLEIVCAKAEPVDEDDFDDEAYETEEDSLDLGLDDEGGAQSVTWSVSLALVAGILALIALVM